MPETGCSARLVWRPDYERYDFGPQHPLTPNRMRCSLDLFRSAGLWPSPEEHFEAPPAGLDELALVHTGGYLDAVQRLSRGGGDTALAAEATRWGLGRGDTPAFQGMHEVSALIAGGSLRPLEAIMAGEFQHAFTPAGGLHHALPDRASGFCTYNDPAVAIAGILQRREARVLYLDLDAHHGDGVQVAFYDNPRVLTVSFHETGRHLFPGTGFVHELGEGPGRGTSLNLPVEPFTEDGSWLEAVDLLVPSLAEWFQPDVIVSQHGCDTHAWDPLTHLHLSTRAYHHQTRLVHELAHRLCEGRWLATGGGGYDWVRVVPRSWAIIWAEQSGKPLPERLPEDWTARWQQQARLHDFWPMPAGFLDDTEQWRPNPRRDEIERANRARAQNLRQLAMPA